jgi:hypothetical protein
MTCVPRRVNRTADTIKEQKELIDRLSDTELLAWFLPDSLP